MSPHVYKLAVCMFPEVATLDFQGPMELLGFLEPERIAQSSETVVGKSLFALVTTYLSYTKEPVKSMAGPLILPDRTYGDISAEEQFDIILIPGGFGARPEKVQPALLEFIKHQAPGATYVLSVCTGTWILAQSGIINGKRVTTNKSTFVEMKNATVGQNIQWVPKARWVVDGKIWTGSGLTAGIDMACAFLEHLAGAEIAKFVRGVAEVSVKHQDDDEFAEVYGLV